MQFVFSIQKLDLLLHGYNQRLRWSLDLPISEQMEFERSEAPPYWHRCPSNALSRFWVPFIYSLTSKWAPSGKQGVR